MKHVHSYFVLLQASEGRTFKSSWFQAQGLCPKRNIKLCEHFLYCIHPSPTQLELYSLGYMWRLCHRNQMLQTDWLFDTKLMLHAVACQLHLASPVWSHIVDRQYFDWQYTVAARCTLLVSFPTDPDCCIGSVDWVGICLVLALLKMVTIWVIQFWHEQENFFFKWQVCEHQ